MKGMERRLIGKAASPGIAIGRVVLLHPVVGEPRAGAAPDLERSALRQAIEATKQSLRSMVARLAGDEAAILEFQIAMLEDPELAREAEQAVGDGQPADVAWLRSMDMEIARYRASDDVHFRSRVSDLADIRDGVLSHLRSMPEHDPVEPGQIVVAEDLAPSHFLRMDWSSGGGIALRAGSPASHVAMLARARSIPMVVGLGAAVEGLAGLAVLDGETGMVIGSPVEESLTQAQAQAFRLSAGRREAERRMREPAVTRDGKRLSVLLNISSLHELTGLVPEDCDGIGLVRTEFLVESALVDEEAQFRAYAALVRWAAGRVVTIRTLDAGGDKPIQGYSPKGEANSFLGLRGIRLSLSRPDIFLVQLRAILRAAALGPTRILLPMVTLPEEVGETRRLIKTAAEHLASAGQVFVVPPIGIMIEVPAAAMAPWLFPVDFFSIGSNDLEQYACASARDNAQLAKRAHNLHPGTLAMMAHVTRFARDNKIDLGLCGDAAGNSAMLPAFLEMGIGSFSVAPGCVAELKAAIRNCHIGDGTSFVA
jgi:phosphotransferase system enzyme I (PtsI)